MIVREEFPYYKALRIKIYEVLFITENKKINNTETSNQTQNHCHSSKRFSKFSNLRSSTYLNFLDPPLHPSLYIDEISIKNTFVFICTKG